MPRGQTILKLWQAADELPLLVVDSDDVSWWAGAQRCFVGVAIAGAAAALGSSVAIAGAFQQQDDLPLAAAIALDDGGWLPPAPSLVTTATLPAWGDEALDWTVDEQYWFAPQWPVRLTIAPMVFVDADFAAPVATLVEDEPWLYLRPVTATIAAPAQSDTDEVVQQAAGPSGGGGGLPFYRRERVSTRFVQWPATDEIPTAAIPLTEAYWQQPKHTPPLPDLRLWTVGDEITQPVSPPEDSALVPEAGPQPVNAIVWAEDEPIVPQPAAAALDDTPWQAPYSIAPRIQVQGPNWDDETLFWPLDEACWWTWLTLRPVVQPAISTAVWDINAEAIPVVPPAAPGDGSFATYGQRLRVEMRLNRWLATDDLPTQVVLAAPWDGSFETQGQRLRIETTYRRWPVADDWVPAAPLLTEEDCPDLPRSLDCATVVIWATNEEIVPQALFIDELYWTPPFSVPVAPVVQVWTHQDEKPTAAAQIAAEDEWQPNAPPRALAPNLAVWRDSDDTLFWPIEETYWEGPPTPKPPPIQLQGPVWDDQALAWEINEEYWWTPQWVPAKVSTLLEQVDDIFIVPALPAPAEEDRWEPLFSVPVQPVARAWIDQDDIVPSAAFALTDDDWPVPVPRAAAPFVQVWTDGDAYASFALAEDDWQAPTPAAVPPIARVWVEQDEVPIPGTFADDAWQVYTPPLEPKRFVYLPDPEELIFTAPAPLAADEDYWLTFPVPPKPILTAFPVDEDVPPLDNCQTLLAAAYARIAELEAELAECRAHHGGDGGGGAGGDGDDVDHGHHGRNEDDEQRRILDNREREKRARIDRNNALILAIAGAVVHGLKGPPE